MSPDLGLLPPHSADELLGQVLARGRALRERRRRRQVALTLGPLSLVLLLVGGIAVAVRGPDDSTSHVVASGPAATQAAPTSSSTVEAFDLDDLVPPPALGSVPAVDPVPASSSSSSPSTSQATARPGSRRAPIAVFDLQGADGRYQTAVLHPGAKQAVAITAPTPERQWPSLSPDGTEVAFNSTQNNLLEGVRSVFELFVVNVDGTGLHQITTSPLDLGHGSRWPSWSPDGKHIVAGCASNDITPDICLLRPDGSGKQVLAPATDGFTMPRWSPDGADVVALQRGTGASATPWLLDPTGRRGPRPALAGAVPVPTGDLASFGDGSHLLLLHALTGGLVGQPAIVDLATGRSTALPGLPPGQALISCGAGQLLYRVGAVFGPAAPGDLILIGLDGSGATVVLNKTTAGALTPTSCATR